MQEKIRLNKYLAEAGVCSRREADRLIEQGKVVVNGDRAAVGLKVNDSDLIEVDGKNIKGASKPVVLAFYKPRGIVCTFEKREKDNIIDYLNYPERVTYAGRLDKESEGLIIMTNQGELVNNMMRARNEHEKEYIVWVDKPVTAEFLKKMSGGIWLEELGVQTRKCRVEKVSAYRFRIVLTQGLNRQIRRMCRSLDYHVRKLVRVRIMNIKLGELEKGQYREITGVELKKLYTLLNIKFIYYPAFNDFAIVYINFCLKPYVRLVFIVVFSKKRRTRYAVSFLYDVKSFSSGKCHTG